MQYMLLIYDDEKKFAEMSEAQQGKVMQEFRDLTHAIVKSGHYRAGDQLQSVSTATSIRWKAGTALVTDGPYAESREQLGGYYLVEAKDLDEAVSIAKRIPAMAVDGVVEVRPVFPRPPGV